MKSLELSQIRPGTQFDVDNKCRVMLKNNSVLNKVFACGIGYPVRTNDGKTFQQKNHNGQQNKPKTMNPRADGFSLYMNIVSEMIIKNILPKEVRLKGAAHKIYPIVEQATYK